MSHLLLLATLLSTEILFLAFPTYTRTWLWQFFGLLLILSECRYLLCSFQTTLGFRALDMYERKVGHLLSGMSTLSSLLWLLSMESPWLTTTVAYTVLAHFAINAYLVGAARDTCYTRSVDTVVHSVIVYQFFEYHCFRSEKLLPTM